MKRVVFAFIVFVFSGLVYGEPNEPASDARVLFEGGLYDEGLSVANTALRDRSISAEKRCEVLRDLAWFYEDLVGNLEMALRNYRKILRSDLPAGHALKAFAREQIARVNELGRKYGREDALIREARIGASKKRDAEQIKDEISQLEAIAENNPAYYRLAEVYYHLGMDYMALKKYAKAHKVLSRPVELKPSVRFYLPAENRAAEAREKWVRTTATQSAWGATGVLLVVTVVGFYAARPWRWVTGRNVLAGAAVIVLWGIVFGVSHMWFGRAFEVSEEAVAEIYAEIPAFVSASPGSAGSEVMKYLFLYGVIGTVGVFVFSIATARLKCRVTAMFLNVVFGLVLLSSLTTVFYLRHLERGTESVFNSQAEGLAHYPQGHVYLYMSDLESYILTNPKAYANLDLGSIGEVELRRWIEVHCPFDEVEERRSQSKPD